LTAALFSLADEAKWASSNRSRAFASDTKLRYSKVEFVSAGLLEGTIKEKTPAAPTSPTAPVSGSPVNVAAMAKMTIRGPSPSPSISSSEDEIVFRGRGTTPFSQATALSTAVTNPTPTLSSQIFPDSSHSVSRQMQAINEPANTPPDTASLAEHIIPQLTASSSLGGHNSSPVQLPSASSGGKKAQSKGMLWSFKKKNTDDADL
jgi:hypothetical protein